MRVLKNSSAISSTSFTASKRSSFEMIEANAAPPKGTMYSSFSLTSSAAKSSSSSQRRRS
eukprot:4341804-Pleurochrysis_carterae.AAC.1